MRSGITIDTGALVALERGDRRMAAVWKAAIEAGVPLTVPAPVVAEWWRGQRGPSANLLSKGGATVEPLDGAMAQRVGVGLAAVSGSRVSLTDATVVVSAALRGDVVYTSDLDDLGRVRDRAFPGVKLFRV